MIGAAKWPPRGLTSVGGDLEISENAALSSLAGLSNLTTVGGHSTIASNPVLCQSLVDAFIAACTSCGPPSNLSSDSNNDSC